MKLKIPFLIVFFLYTFNLLAASSCCPSFVAEADYFLAWRKGRDIPPLISTAPAGEPPILSTPQTEVLFGGSEIGNDPQSGVKGALTFWFGEQAALNVGGFWVGEESTQSSISSDDQGVPSIGIPYFDLFSNTETALDIALQGSFAGSAATKETNKVWGAETSLQWQLLSSGCGNLGFLFGYQYYNIKDSVELNAQTSFLLTENVAVIENRFDTDNTFNGALFGLKTEAAWNCLAFELSARISVGEMNSTIDIQGFGKVSPPTGQLIGFVQDSNRGTYHENQFTIVPEVTAKLSYRVCSNIFITAGYTAIYWPELYLAGNQIDTRLDPFVESDLPTFLNEKSDFWLQGFTVGLKTCF